MELVKEFKYLNPKESSHVDEAQRRCSPIVGVKSYLILLLCFVILWLNYVADIHVNFQKKQINLKHINRRKYIHLFQAKILHNVKFE